MADIKWRWFKWLRNVIVMDETRKMLNVRKKVEEPASGGWKM
jgi:hypothetical protein